MSSAPSGRYQSRLFNFVARQSRRFKRQCDRAFHQLQNTASWAVAVGLSPLLSIFQLNRSSAKQMHQAVEHNLPHLSSSNCDRQPEPPDVDTQIQQVLLLVNALPFKQEAGGSNRAGGSEEAEGAEGESPIQNLKSKIQNPLATRSSSLTTQSIRGIATQLSSRALVLVTAQNEILDILTAQQQQQLQQQIIAAIADYWRYQRLAHLREQGRPRGLRGPREQLPITNYQSKIQNPKSKIYTDSVLAALDRAVAEVESGKLVHLSAVATVLSLAQSVSHSSLQVARQLKTQLNARSRGTQAIAARGDFETSTSKIQTLIWAAIDYFFGGGAKPHLEQSTLNSHLEQSSSIGNLAGIPDLPLKKTLKSGAALLPAKQPIGHRPGAKLSSTGLFSAQLPPSSLVNTSIEDPWLTLDDLFGESVIASETATGQHLKSTSGTISSQDKKPSMLPSHESVRHSLSNFVCSIQKFWSQPKPEFGLVQRQKAAKGKLVEKNNRQQVASSQLSRPNRASEMCDRTSSQSTQMEPNPDWIETHATVMGYVKHPLEQLLAWLDQAMLWLEELCIRVWRWLGQLVAKRTM